MTDEDDNSERRRVDEHVGKRLADLRHARRVKQATLADELGITFQQLDRLEKGQRTLKSGQLFKVCQFFSVDMNYFFEGLGENSAPSAEDEEGEPSPSERAMRVARQFDDLSPTLKNSFDSLLAKLPHRSQAG